MVAPLSLLSGASGSLEPIKWSHRWLPPARPLNYYQKGVYGLLMNIYFLCEEVSTILYIMVQYGKIYIKMIVYFGL